MGAAHKNRAKGDYKKIQDKFTSFKDGSGERVRGDSRLANTEDQRNSFFSQRN